MGMSAIQILPYAGVPDVIEVDEYVNGVRREGAYYGITQFMYKIAMRNSGSLKNSLSVAKKPLLFSGATCILSLTLPAHSSIITTATAANMPAASRYALRKSPKSA